MILKVTIGTTNFFWTVKIKELKVVSNFLKWREKWLKLIFTFLYGFSGTNIFQTQLFFEPTIGFLFGSRIFGHTLSFLKKISGHQTFFWTNVFLTQICLDSIFYGTNIFNRIKSFFGTKLFVRPKFSLTKSLLRPTFFPYNRLRYFDLKCLLEN